MFAAPRVSDLPDFTAKPESNTVVADHRVGHLLDFTEQSGSDACLHRLSGSTTMDQARTSHHSAAA